MENEIIIKFLKKLPKEVLEKDQESYIRFLEILSNLNIKITERDINI
jgi:hypothetical protein